MISKANWTDFSSIDGSTALTTLNRVMPPWVSLFLVIVLGWQLAKIIWMLVPAPASGDPVQLPMSMPAAATQGGPATDVERIAALHMFGEADPAAAPAVIPEALDDNLSDTRLTNLVLKGTIALSRTRFPRGTPGPMLDAIARQPLWAEGLDFGHGTGHGVGYFLNVHEGPQTISKAVPDPTMAIEPGMITSIEPGLYRTGRWGVRIENLVLSVPAPTAEADAFGEMLQFETLTLCPIDTRCVDRTLLRADEIEWLDRYHATVRERLAPQLGGAALAWLQARTAAL